METSYPTSLTSTSPIHHRLQLNRNATVAQWKSRTHAHTKELAYFGNRNVDNDTTVHSQNTTVHAQNTTVHAQNTTVHAQDTTVHAQDTTVHAQNTTVHAQNTTMHAQKHYIHAQDIVEFIENVPP